MSRVRWNLWPTWVAATVAGYELALAIHLWIWLPALQSTLRTVPPSAPRDFVQHAGGLLLAVGDGVVLASVQALIGRRILPRRIAWVAGAAVGSLLAWFLRAWLGGQLTPTSPLTSQDATHRMLLALALIAIAALILAACQWLASLARFDRGGLYIAASVAAAILLWFTGPVVGTAVLRSLPSGLVLADIALAARHGLMVGALTGLALAVTLVRPRAAARRRQPPTRLPHGRRRQVRAGGR